MLGVIEVANGGDFGFSEINHIGDCDCPAQDVLCSPSWHVKYDIPDFPMECTPLSYPNRMSARDYVWNGTINNNVEIIEGCIPGSC